MHPEDLQSGDNVRVQLRGGDRDDDGLLLAHFLDCVYPGRGRQMELRFSVSAVNGVFLPYRQVHQWRIGELRSVTKMEKVT